MLNVKMRSLQCFTIGIPNKSLKHHAKVSGRKQSYRGPKEYELVFSLQTWCLLKLEERISSIPLIKHKPGGPKAFQEWRAVLIGYLFLEKNILCTLLEKRFILEEARKKLVNKYLYKK